jgi:hypothetical protein
MKVIGLLGGFHSACTRSRPSTTPWGSPKCQGLFRVQPDAKVSKAT